MAEDQMYEGHYKGDSPGFVSMIENNMLEREFNARQEKIEEKKALLSQYRLAAKPSLLYYPPPPYTPKLVPKKGFNPTELPEDFRGNTTWTSQGELDQLRSESETTNWGTGELSETEEERRERLKIDNLERERADKKLEKSMGEFKDQHLLEAKKEFYEKKWRTDPYQLTDWRDDPHISVHTETEKRIEQDKKDKERLERAGKHQEATGWEGVAKKQDHEPDLSADANFKIELPEGVSADESERLDEIMTSQTSSKLKAQKGVHLYTSVEGTGLDAARGDHEFLSEMDKEGKLKKVDDVRRGSVVEVSKEVMGSINSGYEWKVTGGRGQHRKYDKPQTLGHVGSGAVDIHAELLGSLPQQEEFMQKMKDLGYHVIDERAAKSTNPKNKRKEKGIIHVSMLPNEARLKLWAEDRHLKGGTYRDFESVREERAGIPYRMRRAEHLLNNKVNVKDVKRLTGLDVWQVQGASSSGSTNVRVQPGKTNSGKYHKMIRSLPKGTTLVRDTFRVVDGRKWAQIKWQEKGKTKTGWTVLTNIKKYA